MALAPLPPDRLLLLEQHRLEDFAAFQALLAGQFAQFASRVDEALRLIALHGILDPLSDAPIAATAIEFGDGNHREALAHAGLVSRQRAVLLALRQLVAAGQLPPLAQLSVYCPEHLTPFATLLHEHVERLKTSEYLPDSDDPLRSRIHHEDLCALSIADASFDLVLCNEILEHVYDFQAALSHICRVIVPGGALVGTVPMAYNQQQTLVKARHRGPNSQPDVIGEPEIHGNPTNPEQGSLVYQIPGWDLLDHLRKAGFARASILAIHAPHYGVVGAEIPYILVYEALKPL